MGKYICPLHSPYAVVALSHNLAVVSGHLEEVGNLHAALVPVFTLAYGYDTIGNFLLDSYGVPTAAARQWTNKFVRCARLRRLSPTIKKRRLKGTYVCECFSVID